MNDISSQRLRPFFSIFFHQISYANVTELLVSGMMN